MILCKKIKIITSHSEIGFIIPKDSGYHYYTNNIGPARITFNDQFIINQFVFIKNNYYTHIPLVYFGPDRVQIRFFTRKEPWFSSVRICDSYYYNDRNYYINNNHHKLLIEGIEKTNLFVEYLNKINILKQKLKPIEWTPCRGNS